jgi:chaperone required for assembly of F1-ATPase
VSDKPNPIAAAQRLAKREPPRRFYRRAEEGSYEGGFAVFLDGKVARTPARKPLAVSDRRIAKALAAEWEAQGERLDFAAMALTRVANAAIDRVAGEMAAVRAEIVKYAGSDLICYRAEGPQSLVEAQAVAWDSLVVWAREVLGLAGTVTGVVIGVALWGLHMGFTQGLLATLVADAAPAELRGTAFGMFNLVTGLTLLAASVIAGGLWDVAGPAGTFLGGAGFTLAAFLGLLAIRGRLTDARNHPQIRD